MIIKSTVFFLCLFSFGASGCAISTAYQKPEVELPQTSLQQNLSLFRDGEWWHVFSDPILNDLELQALAHNADFKQILARVDEARALMGVEFANLLPSVGARGEYEKAKSSLKMPLSVDSAHRVGENSIALAAISYEVDIWGKYRQLYGAARENWIAAEANRDGMRLMLTAAVARNYFALLTRDRQLAIGRRTLESRIESYRIYRSRFENGYCTELDYRRMEAEMASVETTVRNLELEVSRTESALMVLLGATPRQLMESRIVRGNTPDVMGVCVTLPRFIPSDFLTRRPDVFAAEAQLRASHGQVNAARAAFFPSIFLTSGEGSASSALGDLFSSGSNIWNFVGKMTAPLFQGGRIRSQAKAAKARELERLAAYEHVVQNAFREAYDATIHCELSRDIVAARRQQTLALQRSLELAQRQKDSGLVGILDVLDVERGLLLAQMELAMAHEEQWNALINLCEALGGGWKNQSFPELRQKETDTVANAL